MHNARQLAGFLVGLARGTFERYGRLGGGQFAAAIAYRALFSLIPLATFVSMIFGEVLSGREATQTDFVETVAKRLQLSPEGLKSLDSTIAAVPSPWSVVGLITLGLALWGATGVMSSIQKAIAYVFDDGEGRSFVRGRLVSALLVLGVLGLLLAAVGLSLLEGMAAKINQNLSDAFDFEPFELGLFFSVLVPLALALAASVLLIRLLPDAKPSWRAALLGGAAASVGILVIQRGLGWYLSGPVDFTALYGSASAVFAFLFSVYLSASAFVAGAVLSSVFDERRPDRSAKA
jgi:membrane protein